MSIPVSELTENDYKILEYVNRFDSVHKTQIEKYFRGKIEAVDYRLSVLSQAERHFIGDVSVPVQNSYYIEQEYTKAKNGYSNPPKPTGMYHITPLGKSTLQDHLANQKVVIRKRNLELFFMWGNFAIAVIALILSIVK